MTASGPVRVLCVDDDVSIRVLVKAVLERTIQANVEVAESAEAALELLAEGSPPDVLILDIMMPGIDGYELCKQLRLDVRYHRVPIVFLSANNDSVLSRARDAGGDDFIPKPFAAAELGKRLMEAIARRREATS
jgi:CheY-like chemotaxis protein